METLNNGALKKHVCPGRILKNQGELPALAGVMTPEAHTSLVGSSQDTKQNALDEVNLIEKLVNEDIVDEYGDDFRVEALPVFRGHIALGVAVDADRLKRACRVLQKTFIYGEPGEDDVMELEYMALDKVIRCDNILKVRGGYVFLLYSLA